MVVKSVDSKAVQMVVRLAASMVAQRVSSQVVKKVGHLVDWMAVCWVARLAGLLVYLTAAN